MQGLHLTADLHQCQCAPPWLTDAALLGKRCVRAVAAAGTQAVAQVVHAFPGTAQGPGGDHGPQPQALMASLVALFTPRRCGATA